MKVNVIFWSEVILFTIIAILCAVFSGDNVRPIYCEQFNEGFTVMTVPKKDDSNSTYIDYTNTKLPQYIMAHSNEIVLSVPIWDVDKTNSTLAIFCFQQQMYAELDGQIMAEYFPVNDSISVNPGNSWVFLDFQPEDVGKTLSIHVIQCYDDNKVMVPRIYRGTQGSITAYIIRSELAPLIICVACISLGIVIFFFWLVCRKQLRMSRSLYWFSLMIIFRGTWSFIETNIYSFYTNRLLVMSWISYMSLKLGIIPFIMFDNVTFHKGKSRFLNGLAIAAGIDFWGSSILQLLKIKDFAETVFVTHIIAFLLGVYVIVNVTKSVYDTQTHKKEIVTGKFTFFAHHIFMFAIVVTSFMDMYGYYFTNSYDVARFSRLSYVAYVGAVILAQFIDYIKLINLGRLAESIKEHAYTDTMTGFYNRDCFEKDKEQIARLDVKNKGIIMCDLNNLKQYNDNCGHKMGDEYITRSANLIKKFFGEYGTFYRIGGDEFCGIINKISDDEFERIRAKMLGKIDDELEGASQEQLEISVGYAGFDYKLDSNIDDIIERADAKMYENKVELKGESGIIR